MKRLALTLLLLATPACAQQSDPLVNDVVNNSQAEQVMHGNTMKAMNELLKAYIGLQQENATLRAAAKPKGDDAPK